MPEQRVEQRKADGDTGHGEQRNGEQFVADRRLCGEREQQRRCEHVDHQTVQVDSQGIGRELRAKTHPGPPGGDQDGDG